LLGALSTAALNEHSDGFRPLRGDIAIEFDRTAPP
jgi:hypothetical protein